MSAMATVPSLCSAPAVSSMKPVSRSLHSSALSDVVSSAPRLLREGTGKAEALRVAAISRRVSLISALSAWKGLSISASIFSLSSFRVGSDEFSSMSESSSPVGMVTLARKSRLGIEISGIETSSASPGMRFCRQPSWPRGTHVEASSSALDDIVHRPDVLLDTGADRVERVCDGIRDLPSALTLCFSLQFAQPR